MSNAIYDFTVRRTHSGILDAARSHLPNLYLDLCLRGIMEDIGDT